MSFLVRQNQEAANFVQTRYTKDSANLRLELLMSRFDEVLDSVTNRYGFVSWDMAHDFGKAVQSFLNQTVSNLMY